MSDFVNATIFVLVCWWIYSRIKAKRRRAELMRKYGDATIVQRIIKKQIWQGATGEQMVDSLGKPADIDETVMKAKIKTVWKYHKTGKNRYKLRVTLENDIVIGWEFKG